MMSDKKLRQKGRLTTHDSRFKYRAAMLAAVFFLAAWPLETLTASAPDYKTIPKLQEIKDHSPAPGFTLPAPGGRKISLNDYRGKVVLLNFWATWCPDCRTEMPAMDRLYREFKGQGFEIVAVNVKDKREDALAFVKKNKISYPIMMDPEGEVGLLYGAFAMPTTYLIDRKGVVLARMWGSADWNSPAARKLIGEIVQQK
jgi:DsbE subfamily thiol:disulfide oxidoreductase